MLRGQSAASGASLRDTTEARARIVARSIVLVAIYFSLAVGGFGSCSRPALAAEASSLPDVDWPTLQQNNQRNAVVPANIDLARLAPLWTDADPFPPTPAWYGPAKWDAYAGIKNLKSMRDYDSVNHLIAVGDAIFIGSSTEECVRCLDAETGGERWCFFTNGPVRVAPTYDHAKIYFGSDDGFAYCLEASTGQLLWKYRPVDADRLVIGDGRLLPFHPIRTGVLVQDGLAYFGASLLPWETSYLCAVAADTGRADRPGCFVQHLDQQTLEGAMASTDKLLIAPQGRVAPDVFARPNGSRLGSLPGGGGSFIVVTGNEVFHGPGNKTGWITSSNPENQTQIASYGNAQAIVAYDQRIIMLTDDSLVATDHQRKPLWNVECDASFALLGAGNVLFTGGTDKIVAYALVDGTRLWQSSVSGKVHGLAFARGRLFATTDTGKIYAFGTPAEDVAHRGSSSPQTDLAASSDAADWAPVAPPTIDETGLLSRWVFQRPQVHLQELRDLQNHQPGRLSARARLVRVGDRQALRLDGQYQSATLTDDHRTARLPRQDLTAEAWVRLDRSGDWGGLLGAVLDNGSLERGWLLGTRKKKFVFAVSSVNGPDRLTYLSAGKSLEWGQWYHVAGTYDGQAMRLFVNGELAAESAEQNGAIRYPDQTAYEIGAYRDSDEYYPLEGLLHEVRLYGRALSAAEIADQFRAARTWFPDPATVTDAVSPTTHRLALGPWLQFTSPSTAVVRWHTRQPSPSRLAYRLDDHSLTVADETPKSEHEVTLTDLKHNRVYLFNIHEVVDGVEQVTGDYECDTFFNYTLPALPAVRAAAANSQPRDPAAPPISDEIRRTATELLSLALGTRSEPSTNRSIETRPSRTPLPATVRGLCLVIGDDTEALICALAAESDLRVIGLWHDAARLNAARQRLHDAGLYGPRIILRQVDSWETLRVTPKCANLVVLAAEACAGLDAGQIRARWLAARRLVAPRGLAVVCDASSATAASRELRQRVPALAADVAAGDAPPRVVAADDRTGAISEAPLGEVPLDGSLWLASRGAPLAGAGDWSHVYGAADNSAYGGESLARASTSADLAVQWIGRPGPRYQADRNGRKPPPLSTAGRLFLQGLHRVLAIDIYNGTILWSLELPHMDRYNMPRDCGNWCADDRSLYVVIDDGCWQIDAASGQLVKLHAVVPTQPDLAASSPTTPDAAPRRAQTRAQTDSPQWGYVARSGKLLIGSTAKAGSSWTNFWGNEAWYDGTSGEVTHKVCSDQLFAIDPESGERAWTYQQGVVVHSTVTVGNGAVYFVESRNPDALAATSGRLSDELLWKDQYLVALDAQTGEQIWRSPLQTEAGTVAYYMAHSNNKLVIVSSADVKYHVYAFDAQVGAQQWETALAWGKGKADHGSHLSRPAIVGDKLFVRPAVIELSSGKISEQRIPVGGCGTYACTDAALFFRAGSGSNFAMWDSNEGTYSQWNRLRPDCWLSTIPAGGMLLSPEGGGGCSCGKWMETSVGFIPVKILGE